VKAYEVSQKIWIKEGYLPTVIDLFKQIEKLEVFSGGTLLKYDHQVAYPRMISKYFAHGGNDIPVETLRNYKRLHQSHLCYAQGLCQILSGYPEVS